MTRDELQGKLDALERESDDFLAKASEPGFALSDEDKADHNRREYLAGELRLKLSRMPADDPPETVDAMDEPDVSLSDEKRGMLDEAQGRILKDKQYRDFPFRLPDHEGQLRLMASSAMSGDALPDKFPRNKDGVPAVKLRHGVAERFFSMANRGINTEMLLQLAYDSGTGTHGLGDSIPTITEADWFEVQERVIGIYNLPGIQRFNTGDSRTHDFPYFEEYSVTASTPADNTLVVAENTASPLREGDGGKRSATPQEISALARVPRTLVMNSAADVNGAVVRGLAKTILRIEERVMARGSNPATADPIFASRTGRNVNIAANTGPTADELLELIGLIPPRETTGMPVLMLNWTTLYQNVLNIKMDNKYVFTDTYDGDRRRVFGVPVYTSTYAPSAVNAANSIFGQFFYPEGYAIVKAGDTEILMSDQAFWTAKQTAYMAIDYFDAVILEPALFASITGKA